MYFCSKNPSQKENKYMNMVSNWIDHLFVMGCSMSKIIYNILIVANFTGSFGPPPTRFTDNFNHFLIIAMYEYFVQVPKWAAFHCCNISRYFRFPTVDFCIERKKKLILLLWKSLVELIGMQAYDDRRLVLRCIYATAQELS